MYNLYADASATIVPRRGGWAFIVQNNDIENIGYGFEEYRGTNRMELLAIIKGLDTIPFGSNVLVFTDSLFVITGVLAPIKLHKDISILWLRLQEHMKTMTIRFQKVGSGLADPIHKRAHHLARDAVFHGISTDYCKS
jgi:ribonuclease HI